ncbi:Zinc ABC transporter, periplasmic-binding protein ZnuA [hydrothermal vent metagenome]|uniref:Zinc ABC transporter, periplasmic-binding protein ZnuA n=1 Tax=hydrothermal vent metagenome TaxID=652676 RepID=A0A1W1BZE2_9ZZZZ
MKNIKNTLLLLTLLSSFGLAKIYVIASYPYLGKIVQAVGGDAVKVKVLASPKRDPHFITPKPSLIPAISRADLLVANGAGLEIGWLPPLIRSGNNPKVRIGSKGFVDVSRAIHLIDIPKSVSRAMGDVHPEGNPHFDTDPHNILPIAKLITKKLSIVDPTNKNLYAKNLKVFTKEWRGFLSTFDRGMKQCKSKKIIQYHELFNYFLKRYNIKSLANIEPLPGISPSSKHTLELIRKIKQENIKNIIQDVYHEKRTAKFIAQKTGAKVIILPHDVGSVSGTKSLQSFYTTIEERLCH